ncbi:MAG: hypothetical protein EXQ58_00275 [Acidobacteria bacterium]|nr:hypothetical protein [Acidobacteriota bacterium]
MCHRAPLSRRQFLLSTGLASIGAHRVASLQASQPIGSEASLGDRAASYLTDLNKCQPMTGLSRQWKHKAWRLLEYATDSFRGTMLIATEESDAPPVTYSVNRQGWHEIYIGIFRKPFEESKQVQVKLTDDPAYTSLTGRRGETDHLENWIDEIFWKTADLTGRGITFRQITRPEVFHSWVAYIKLVPLDDQRVAELARDRQRTDTKRLFVHADAHFSNLSGSAMEIRNYLEPLRHSDVSRIYWEAGGGERTLYFSKIARDYSSDLEQIPGGESKLFFPRSYDRELAHTWLAYHKNGVDPLKLAADFTHEMGMEFHAGYRVGGFVYPPPHDPKTGSFYEKHPELLCIGRDGTALPRISYAFPETRRYVISILREIASNYPVDGVCLLYNRRPPLVAYEAPLVEGFKSRYGQDPRQLDEKDPRWLTYRSTVLTQFMRELRQELDSVARDGKRPRRLEISAIVFREDENQLHGMDLKAWIQEGLVDTLIPYSSAVRLNSYQPAWDKPQDVAYFVALVKGTKCRLALNLMPRNLTEEQYRQKAHTLGQVGVENFFFWDGIVRVREALRLGHREEVSAWMAAGQPSVVPSSVRLRRLGKWDLNVETPG